MSSPLIPVLLKLDEAYANGRPLISDVYYDVVREVAQKQSPKDKYFKKVGAPLKASGRVEEKLPIPMGSLLKKRPKEAIEWLAKYPAQHFLITQKLDGLAIMLEYRHGKLHQAYTRGRDGITGFAVLNTVQFMQHVKMDLNLFLKPFKDHKRAYVIGEAVIGKNTFKRHISDKIKYARQAMVGAVNALNLTHAHKELLRDMEFIVHNAYVPGLQINKSVLLNTLRKPFFKTVMQLDYRRQLPAVITQKYLDDLLVDWRAKSPYPVDGLVVEIEDWHLRDKLGVGDDLRPKFAYAVKPELADQFAVQGVLDRIELNISQRRLYIPVGIMKEPLVFPDAKVQRFTLHNMKNVIDKRLGPGAVVTVSKSGDIIPAVNRVIKPAFYEVPEFCYYCTGKLRMSGPHLLCPNKKCEGPKIRRLRHFFAILKVDGLSNVTIENMVKAKINTIPKMLQASPKQLAGLPGFGDKKVKSIQAGLQALLTNVKLDELMHAAGSFAGTNIGIGKRRFRPIIKCLGEKVIIGETAISEKTMQRKLLAIPGVGEVVAEQFIKQLPEFREFYKSLKNVKLAKPKGKLIGKTFCFTGYRDRELEALIVKNGGEIVDSVSRSTSVLFAKDTGTTKAAKAAKLSVAVVAQARATQKVTEMIK